MILKRGFMQILLAALLLMAQYAALTHGYKHWQQDPATIEQKHDGGKQSSKVRMCDFHCAFTEVLGAAVGTAGVLGIIPQSAERNADPLAHSHTARLLTPLSRGPPVLL